MDGVVYYKNFHGLLSKIKATGIECPESIKHAIDDTHEYLDGLDVPPRTVLVLLQGYEA